MIISRYTKAKISVDFAYRTVTSPVEAGYHRGVPFLSNVHYLLPYTITAWYKWLILKCVSLSRHLLLLLRSHLVVVRDEGDGKHICKWHSNKIDYITATRSGDVIRIAGLGTRLRFVRPRQVLGGIRETKQAAYQSPLLYFLSIDCNCLSCPCFELLNVRSGLQERWWFVLQFKRSEQK